MPDVCSGLVNVRVLCLADHMWVPYVVVLPLYSQVVLNLIILLFLSNILGRIIQETYVLNPTQNTPPANF